MEWVPQQMWLTYLRIGEQTGRLRYDLAIDKSGTGTPSRVMAGLEAPPAPEATTSTTAAPTTTTKPKPKPQPKPKPPTPTTAAPAPPTTTPVVDPSLSVIVEPPAPAGSSTPAPETVALPPALPTSHDGSGTSAAVLIAAIGGGALASGLTAWKLQTRSRRRATQP
jgi:outer membrane biosynthesis protein TonB